jgi:hypothetical protein
MTEPNALPRRHWWLLVLMCLLAVFQANAALRVLSVPDTLAAQINLPLPLQFVVGALWALVSLTVGTMLWRRKPGAARLAVWLCFAFSIYSLLRLFLFTQADYDRGRLPFLVVLTVLILFLPAVWLIRHARARLPDGDYP